MITNKPNYDPAELYSATDGGLWIIRDYCEVAREACEDKNERLHFSYSDNDKTPSAHIHLRRGTRYGDVWYIKDFSTADRSLDPIDVFCEAEGLSRSGKGFYQAMETLYARYGLDARARDIREDNREIWDDPVPAPEDKKEGEWLWEGARELTAEEIKVLSKFATKEIVNELGWSAIEKYGVVKEGKIRWVHSTENFPIFIRRCIVYKDGQNKGAFFKKYAPFSFNKQYRFLTFDNDHLKTDDYICNIEEYNNKYQEQLDKFNNKEIEKIPEFLTQGVVLCCGERDAVACRSMGWWPIWLNSETAGLTEQNIMQIRKRNKKCPIYYIPDLDATGQQVMKKIAREHPDIWVVELPQALRERRDNRGKQMKDLRDWVESTPNMSSYHFDNLMMTAHRAQFWDRKETKSGTIRIDIDTDCLHFFLRVNGIQTIKDDDVQTVEFGRTINEYVIQEMSIKEVNDFVLSWARDALLPREVKNALTDGTKLDEAKLMKMEATTFDFTAHDNHRQLFYFKDCVVEVTDKGVNIHSAREAAAWQNRVWKKVMRDRSFRFVTHMERNVPLTDRFGRPRRDKNNKPILGDFRKRTKLFHYTRTYDEKQHGYVLDIDINPEAYKSKAFCIQCATSHIYWLDEETALLGEGKTREQIKEYWRENWGKLDSPYLTPDKIYEQKASLISKLFIIGYYGWDYKSPSEPWAAYVMDDYDGEGSNGGSGKSIIFKYIQQYKDTYPIQGRKKEEVQSKHIFAPVTTRTRVILFDDFMFNFSDWYPDITGDMKIERKGIDPFYIEFERSPKLAFSTNKVEKNLQGSSLRRMIRTTCASFFHGETETFPEACSPVDFTGHSLWNSDYSDEEWHYDDNIFIECVEEAIPFIKQSIKIEPPMGRVELRQLRKMIGKASIDFFDDYFRPGETSHANKFISREDFISDYQRGMSGKSEYLSATEILERCAMWSHYRSWVLGYCPKGVIGWTNDLKGKYRSSRIVQRGNGVSIEGIYIATIDNQDPNLQYLKEGNEECQREEEQIKAAVAELSKPEYRELPL